MSITVSIERISSDQVEGVAQDLHSEKGELTIGRTTVNDIVLAEPDVSSKHAKLYLETSGDVTRLYVLDVGSANGTYIEDYRLPAHEPYEVDKDERIIISCFVLRARIAEEGAEESGTEGLASEIEVISEELDASESSASPASPVLETSGHSGVDRLLWDPAVSALFVQSNFQVYVERDGTVAQTDIRLSGPEEVYQLAGKLLQATDLGAGQRIPESEVRLPSGSRLCVPSGGRALILRKAPSRNSSLSHLVGDGALSEDMAALLRQAIETRQNIVVAGPPRSGRTTMLSALCSLIPRGERVLNLDRLGELRLTHPHVFSFAGDSEDAAARIRDTLFHRPDRLVFGECSGKSLLDLLLMVQSGARGVLCSTAGATAQGALRYLELLLLKSTPGLSAHGREHLVQSVDVIITLRNCACGRRLVSGISEVGNELGPDQRFTITDLFTFHEKSEGEHGKTVGFHEATGAKASFAR